MCNQLNEWEICVWYKMMELSLNESAWDCNVVVQINFNVFNVFLMFLMFLNSHVSRGVQQFQYVRGACNFSHLFNVKDFKTSGNIFILVCH